MTKQQTSKKQSSFIFNVDIMVEDSHHATALEQLLRGLNACSFSDYRITAGIQLGELIEHRKTNTMIHAEIPIVAPEPKSSATPPPASAASESTGFDNIRSFMKSNILIRLIVNRGLGIKLSIPCRIINMDEQEQLLTVYHVDEKQVYTFRINEIEDLIQ